MLLRVSNYDSFWLGLYDTTIDQILIQGAPGARVRPSGMLLTSFCEAVAALVDVKADHLAGRGRRVSEYVRAMPLGVGMSPESVEMMTLAALWNDVGALDVPGRILVKPDLLSLDEMERMRSHPASSGEILARIPTLRPAARWVAAHHERQEGRGYPEMLHGAAITPEAEILSISDAYVAVISPRPYRGAMLPKDAIAVVEARAGAQ